MRAMRMWAWYPAGPAFPERPPIVSRRAPGHVVADPDEQSPPLPERCVVADPVRRAIAGERWLAHAPRLTPWILTVNPWSSHFCNNAKHNAKANSHPSVHGVFNVF